MSSHCSLYGFLAFLIFLIFLNFYIFVSPLYNLNLLNPFSLIILSSLLSFIRLGKLVHSFRHLALVH